MSTLRFEIEGELGSITVRGFLAAVESAFSILRDYDAAVSKEPRGTLDWVITDISSGSAVIVAESRSRFEGKNVGPEVAERFVRGWAQIENEGTTPAYLSPTGMQQSKRLVRLIGREGTTGFKVTDLTESVEITPKASVNLDKLLRVRFHSLGSVEGRIETVSIHGRPRFIVYHSRTRKAVLCSVPRGELQLVPTNILGHRVIVSGTVHSNALGEILRIDAERIRPLRNEDDLPSIESLGGSDPDFTGDMTTDEYLRMTRGA